MGYCIDVTLREVIIPADKVAACLEVINRLCEAEHIDWFRGGNPFTDLPTAFSAIRYHATTVDNDVELDYFEGEKLGSDEAIWKALASFVKDGAEIYFRGEDDNHWKYVFKNGNMTVHYGYVVFPVQE
jgi:hypothetical protein